ncbi:MAG: UTP--glucose-1-phosphate uridylyltransferase [Akkermansiaceae bacterium]|jgi:UTP--glucose-1-phosphate uridylyltransferase
MSEFDAFEKKMRAAGMGDAPVAVFKRNFEALQRNKTGMIPEQSIEPASGLPKSESLTSGGQYAKLSEVVVIKLNGGLGTGMGLQGPKSLLVVREGVNFLDLMVRQTLSLREKSGQNVRLLLMNSFSTSEDTLAHLQRYTAQSLASANEVEMMQNMVPKIDAATMKPVEWPADPEQEWCPPGHGDVYPALVGSGWLDRLLNEGVKYAFVSNSDNLGAVFNDDLLDFFAKSGAPFMMEVTRRTAADKKGGHLAMRKSDGRLLLREVAQCPDEDLNDFQNIDKHQYFNTNSLWLNLEKLKAQLVADSGALPLPMIKNKKTVDPRDPKSIPVFQLENAMGSAIECFEGALAIDVPRSRFAPVKTTADLLALRSDAYEVLIDGQVRLSAERKGVPPDITLSGEYKLVDSLDDLGVPSLIKCNSLKISGLIQFAPGVIIEGDVAFENTSAERKLISAGTYKNRSY